MLSLPPMAGSSSPNWAERAPSSAAAGFPQRAGSVPSFSKYSWKVSRARAGPRLRRKVYSSFPQPRRPRRGKAKFGDPGDIAVAHRGCVVSLTV